MYTVESNFPHVLCQFHQLNRHRRIIKPLLICVECPQIRTLANSHVVAGAIVGAAVGVALTLVTAPALPVGIACKLLPQAEVASSIVAGLRAVAHVAGVCVFAATKPHSRAEPSVQAWAQRLQLVCLLGLDDYKRRVLDA